MGLVAPWHKGSSGTRDQTCVPCIDRQILNHWTTRDIPQYMFFNTMLELPNLSIKMPVVLENCWVSIEETLGFEFEICPQECIE